MLFPEGYDFVNPGTESLKHGLPWIAPSAITKLAEILKPTDVVIDLGTGGSTKFFAKRCLEVYGFETETTWWKYVCDELSDYSNVHLTLSDRNSQDWKLSPNVIASVICVDTMHPVPRDKLLLNFLAYASPNAIFVLDNWADSAVWNDFCGLSSDGILEKLCLTEHEVEDHFCPGFSGFGTRLILPKQKGDRFGLP